MKKFAHSGVNSNSRVEVAHLWFGYVPFSKQQENGNEIQLFEQNREALVQGLELRARH